MTREEKRNNQIEFLKSNPDIFNLNIQEWENLIFVMYDKRVGKLSQDNKVLYPHLIVYHKKKQKPISNFYYLSLGNREKEILKLKEQELSNKQREEQFIKAAQEKNHKIQVGTILYSSWGYEQTNIDFYIVIERKNQIIILQEIGCKITQDNRNDRGKCIADPNTKKGDPFKKRLSKWGGIILNSYKSASIWDGNELYWSSYY